MTSLKRELWATCVAVVVTAATGTALAQSPDDTQPQPQPQPQQVPPPQDPLTTPPVDPNAPTPPLDPNATPPIEPVPEPAPVVEPVVTPVPVPVAYEGDPTFYDRMLSLGFSLAAGGGVSGFTNDDMRGATDTGGSWTVRAVFGTRSPLAFEASYIGSAQSIDALGLDNDAVLLAQGIQGALRLNATTNYPVQPFLFGGAAWSHYSLTNTDINTSDVEDDDNVLEIPVGVGIATNLRGFAVDVRGEMRFATNENLVPEVSDVVDDEFAKMHRWGVNATIGYAF